jgi:hypothetical protein
MANGKCKCGVEFTRDNSTATVFKRQRGFCRACDEVYQQQYYKDHADKIKTKAALWAIENIEKRKLICKKNLDSLPEERKDRLKKIIAGHHRQRMYGSSQEEFERQLENQRNLCAICQTLMIKGVKDKTRPCQDHDHASGKLREILCSNCNSLLGMCSDDKKILAGAIQYLQKHETDSSIQVRS